MRLRLAWLSLLFSVVLLAQEPGTPHDPAPWMCAPTSKTHPCACKRMDADPYCEGTPIEDQACKRYCEHGKCGCPVACKVS